MRRVELRHFGIVCNTAAPGTRVTVAVTDIFPGTTTLFDANVRQMKFKPLKGGTYDMATRGKEKSGTTERARGKSSLVGKLAWSPNNDYYRRNERASESRWF